MTEKSQTQGVMEAVMAAALILVGTIFWHLYTRAFAANGTASAEPAIPAPMAGGIPVLALGQNAVAPDRRWLLLPFGA